MTWMLFVVGAVVFWGMYGPALHQGQVLLGNPWRALLCVGVAYFLVGILVPIAGLAYEGALGGFNWSGSWWATLGGALGAFGAVCIIWAFKAGGVPTYVMPLVFAGAPLVNVIVSIDTNEILPALKKNSGAKNPGPRSSPAELDRRPNSPLGSHCC